MKWFQPPFYFPKPTGPYAIGTKTYHWVDTKRQEVHSSDQAHPYRELMVKIWYPAQPSPKNTTPYATDLVNYLKKNQLLFWLFSGYCRSIYSFAQPNGLFTKDFHTYPVLLYSHGRHNSHFSNTAHCENMASHGYVVFGINHTYDACTTKFSDGREIIADISQDSLDWIDSELATRVQDAQFVLDMLQEFNDPAIGLYNNILDLEHIGIFGHSFGGSAATQLCRIDSRIKACVNLDGGPFSKNIEQPQAPYMFITGRAGSMTGAKGWSEEKMPDLLQFFRELKNDGYLVTVQGASHNSFTDHAILKDAVLLPRFLATLCFNKFGVGPINGFRVTEIVNDYLMNFFDKYLKNKPSQLLDSDIKKYNEVVVKQLSAHVVQGVN